MTLPEIAIRKPVTIGMILVSMIVLGSIALVRLPLAFLPEQEEPEIFVMVPYANATPQQVERMIVRPLEEALGSMPGLKDMWSMCNEEGGRVRLNFDWGTDMSLVRVEVRERVDRIRRDLPEDIDQIFVTKSWDARESEAPIMEGRLASARDLSESYDLLDRKIVKPLERIPGVAQVRLDGVNPKEVRVNLRLADLESHRIDVRAVSQLLAASNFDQSLGEVTEPHMSYRLRTIGTFEDVQQIRDLVLREDGLRLSDVADVVYEEPALEYGRHLDGQFAIGITVNSESNANTVTVCDEVKARVEAMGSDPELDGVNFLIWFNQGKEIKNTLKDLLFTGIFGAILASLVLYLFLRRFSATAIAVSCIPFSLIVACGWIWAQGKTMNTITLLGLIVGIGMLVDNAVVVMENIFRHQERGLPRKESARLGSSEVSTAVIAATLTSVIVFLPMIFNKPSEMNLILRELGITVCLTLLASLLVSQTLIPLATAHLLSARPKPKRWWFGKMLDRGVVGGMARVEKRYLRMLSFNLRHRWVTPVVGFVITASAAIPFLKVDKNFDANETEAFVGIRY
ncbi:MAG: efflux RND transporter permease subunit [Candidatus Eisenbacteria bacterium]|uniref:Efflux RND transporter permease subunit n=1 Tax=Eiseniibacteriota bacterium TaxID=2212470 RepID=A0A956RPC0_UNCEI|nr:efflux RND transporter permease subunit [Candidatus Eisenbacteria bacterium]